MRITRFIPLALLLTVVTACATTVRAPVDTVPAGNYLLVDPEPAEYTAVAVNQGAYTVRVGDQVWSGKHWLDGDGRYHMVDDTGPCAGMESVWTYEMMGNQITMNLVSDACTTREFAETQTWER
ncbi:MAG: hypothetical protein GWN71_01540, partial [Gammaproteobacteria bacterium]|nr:hypothetical protein [Actinomycetota bacterium]NIU72298.1 hypothetical protein [Gammaproteobacteria bacterium]